MRRNDKELSDPVRITEILSESPFCHIAMSGKEGPYCIPMCFAYHQGKIILHSAAEGKKIEILHENPQVCILVEKDCTLITAQTACGYGMAYESVMIEGIAEFLDGKKKSDALEHLAKRYAGASGGPYSEAQMANLAVIEVSIISCSGRRSGPAPA